MQGTWLCISVTQRFNINSTYFGQLQKIYSDIRIPNKMRWGYVLMTHILIEGKYLKQISLFIAVTLKLSSALGNQEALAVKHIP